ncbi:hypothetical protein ABBQ32_012281 [Trebouxia sp. C0010 RCD-2024]
MSGSTGADSTSLDSIGFGSTAVWGTERTILQLWTLATCCSSSRWVGMLCAPSSPFCKCGATTLIGSSTGVAALSAATSSKQEVCNDRLMASAGSLSAAPCGNFLYKWDCTKDCVH